METEEKPTVVTADEVATEMGWTADKEAFEEKNPGKPWVDSKTYLIRQREFNDKLKGKLDTVEGTVLDIKKHFDKQLEVEKKKLQDELTDLKEQRKYAIREGDESEVERIETEIAAKKEAVVTPPEVDPAVDAWQKKNPWYLKDERLRKKADAIARGAQAAGINDLDGIFAEVDDLMSDDVKTYNERKRTKIPDESPVDPGGRQQSKGKHHTYSDLNATQKAIHDTYVRQGCGTSAQYIKELEEQGVLA